MQHAQTSGPMPSADGLLVNTHAAHSFAAHSSHSMQYGLFYNLCMSRCSRTNYAQHSQRPVTRCSVETVVRSTSVQSMLSDRLGPAKIARIMRSMLRDQRPDAQCRRSLGQYSCRPERHCRHERGVRNNTNCQERTKTAPSEYDREV